MLTLAQHSINVTSVFMCRKTVSGSLKGIKCPMIEDRLQVHGKKNDQFVFFAAFMVDGCEHWTTLYLTKVLKLEKKMHSF